MVVLFYKLPGEAYILKTKETTIFRNTISPWGNGGSRAPTGSSVSGTILFRWPSGIISAMLPEKKTGTHY